MFRVTVRLDERASVTKETEKLRLSAQRSGLDPADAGFLSSSFAEILDSLVENSRKLKAQGSRFDVTRKLEGKGYSVTLQFGTSRQPSFFARLWQRLRAR